MKKVRAKQIDKMSDLISENYPILMVMSRFGIPLGVGEKSIKEVCEQYGVDTETFLSIANFFIDRNLSLINLKKLNVVDLINYLHTAHRYFLDYRLPAIREQLIDAISSTDKDVRVVFLQFYDEYVKEVNNHMSYEEDVVFPYVRKLLKGELDARYSIDVFRKKHDQIELKIIEFKNIFIKYYPGKDSFQLQNVLFEFFATEHDLASHNIIEDEVFVPVVAILEDQVKKESGK